MTGMNWNIPNTLTVLRLFAAPAVAIMFLYFTRPYADWFALLLFVLASLTDWLDGYLARAWGQESKIGAMLDPIADKAMVIIALAVIIALSGMNPWILLPATVILFREVFVSGLREFLGDTAGTLKVTKLAKWKTTAQMVAIAVLFSSGIFEHSLVMQSYGMGGQIFQGVMDGSIPDEFGLVWKRQAMDLSWLIGTLLLSLAAVLTLVTGLDYLRKAWPHLKDTS